MPKNMSENEIIEYIKSIDIEQDSRSCHCYFSTPKKLEGKVVVDIGGAEGKYCSLFPFHDIESLPNNMLTLTKRTFTDNEVIEMNEWIKNKFTWKHIVSQLDMYLRSI